jgi:putative FmdB family regulatory protein
MPHYEFFCNACETTFDVTLTLREHEEEPMRCPQCGSEKVHQLVSAFSAVTSKKS